MKPEKKKPEPEKPEKALAKRPAQNISALTTADEKIEALTAAVVELQETVRSLAEQLAPNPDPIGGGVLGGGSVLDRDGSVFRGGSRTSSGLTAMDALSLCDMATDLNHGMESNDPELVTQAKQELQDLSAEDIQMLETHGLEHRHVEAARG